MPAPIDPSFAVSGPEWGVGGVEPLGPVGQTSTEAVGTTEGVATQGEGFGDMLSNALGKLQETQTEAAGASQSLANGTATDPTSVVMAVERAQLAMQLASQVRNKAVEAYQDIFHTQV